MSGLFGKLSAGLRKTSQVVQRAFGVETLNDEALEDLLDALIATDMGSAAASALINTLKQAPLEHRSNIQAATSWLADHIGQKLKANEAAFSVHHQPTVILVLGVNGNGKTTTIGKLAKYFTAQHKRVMLIAADTFRAAAVQQLQEWSTRSGALFFSGADGADPASVVYAGLEKALSEKADIVCIDTAGRLHTKQNLMDELQKITRVIQKIIPDAPHHSLLVLDATTGQNALAQAKAFYEAANISGLVITKLDGTAKAGVVVALTDSFGLPVHFVGVGEGEEDLLAFDGQDFACALMGIDKKSP